MPKLLLTRSVPLIILMLIMAGCSAGGIDTSTGSPPLVTDIQEENMFKLTSSAFTPGKEIPDRYTYKLGSQCNGENFSPPLSWEGVPAGTKSLLLTMVDPDGGNWVHWLLLDIPADVTSLTEVINGPEIGIPGRNSFGENGYGGPCPPSGTHRYIFTLYALDTTLNATPGISLKDAKSLFENHILAQCELTGLRSRK